MDTEILLPSAILDQLTTTVIPRQVRCYTRIDSTMDTAREWLQHATPEDTPLLVIADSQATGRGRMHRPWVAPPGSALLFSLGLRPDWLDPTHANALIWLTGVSMCEGIASATGLQPRLKWPNDVLLPLASHGLHEMQSRSPACEEQALVAPAGWGKAAGILLEMSSMADAIERAIIGCGLNVSTHPTAEIALRYPATDVSAALGRPVARLPVLRALLQRMDDWYVRLQHGAFDQLFAVWRDLLLTLGHDVQIRTNEGTLIGYAEDVEPSGALRLRDATGQVHIVSSGDIRA